MCINSSRLKYVNDVAPSNRDECKTSSFLLSVGSVVYKIVDIMLTKLYIRYI